jgi:WD40-like Beta Propeller Repeat
MSRRSLAFWVVAGLCVLVAGASVVVAAMGSDKAAGVRDSAVKGFHVASVAEPVVYRDVDKYAGKRLGSVAVASRAKPGSPHVTNLRCSRVAYTAGHGLCVRPNRQGTGLEAVTLSADLRPQHVLAISGTPSRARISPDGRYGTATTFVSGDSYLHPGQFSTRAVILDMATGRQVVQLEQLKAFDLAGREVDAPDVNFWGVTFARDDDTFYATMQTGGQTYLMRGSLERRELHALRRNVECPSLSPDGTRIAYKHLEGDGAGAWRIHVLDLKTMKDTALAEDAFIDDQVEWLDDANVLYARDGSVWKVPADGSGEPSVFLRGAESPAVVRAPGL